jgi:branched-chain amino acid transport system ATP-binding protein
MTEQPAPALAIRGITAGYGHTTVLRDVSLDVPQGKVAAVLGPNGAGKTTLLRAAAGLLRPSNGTVLVAGKEVTRLSPHRRARAGVCLIPEGRGIFPGLSVRENLLLQIPKWDKSSRMDDALELFPVLGKRLGDHAGRLSGGQQQMLALARCVLANPSVVLLDEVSMGLAPIVVDQIFGSLQQLATRGVALLLVEQYVNRALAMADVAHLLNRGKLIYSGPPSGLDEEAVLHGYLGTQMGAAHAAMSGAHEQR